MQDQAELGQVSPPELPRPSKGTAFLATLKRYRYVVYGALIILVVIAGVVGWAAYRGNRNAQRSSATPLTIAHAAASTLQIASDPSGVAMEVTQQCSTTLRQITPFACVSATHSLDITVTAPAQAVVNGKTFSFKTWDGCSASNADQKICRVMVDKGKAKSVKAKYVAGGAPAGRSDSGSSASSAATPAPAGGATSTSPPSSTARDIDNQCQKTLSIDYNKNMATCTLNKLVDRQVLVFAMEWIGAAFTTEPPVTATCNKASNATESCTLYHGSQAIAMEPTTPMVVNNNYAMGTFPGLSYNGHVSIVPTITALPPYAAVSLSFPYTFSADNKNFRLAGFDEYNNAPWHAPAYYLNWKYEALN